jgi:nucleotidyltransferase/DNA polymerase involved in DNA repair
MALAAVGDHNSFIASCERFARENGTEASVMAEVGLPLARAVVAHRRGAYEETVELLVPVRAQFRRIGGSHAQRDLFDQLLIDAAWRGRQLDVASELLAERTTHRPRNIWGWKHYAQVLDARGAPGAQDARRTLAALRGR